MTELDQVIAKAHASEGKQEEVNQVYLLLLRSDLFVPIKKQDTGMNHVDEEPFHPLFAKIDNNYFMMAFDTLERLTAWAGEHMDEMDYVQLAGKEIIAGISDKAHFCLNMGTEFYKEFSPDELKHLKKIVERIDRLAQG